VQHELYVSSLHVVTKANMWVHQGIWQFMSLKLTSQQKWYHNLRDNLESLIYVFLWVTLMYSECSNQKLVVLFMEGVLDSQPHGTRGGLSKLDFLKGRSLLGEVDFPNWPALHNLIDQLA
jgi:hypothetical protein